MYYNTQAFWQNLMGEMTNPAYQCNAFLTACCSGEQILRTQRANRNVTRDISASHPLSEFHYSYVEHYYTEFIAGKCADFAASLYRVTVLSSEPVYCFRLWCTETAT